MRASLLLVDDNEQDLELAALALAKLGLEQALVTAGGGEAALKYLLDAGTPWLPALVLLDIRMPRLDGHEVLAAIKSHRRLRHLPVVMFSASALPADIDRSYALGAAGYTVKPLQFDLLVRTFGQVTGYWLGANRTSSLSA